MLSPDRKRFFLIIGCLFLVYLSWGSSFIGLKFALESFPPFMLIGFRMGLAGVFLYVLTWLKGERTTLNREDWKQDMILGFMMVAMGSGFLSVGQASVSTGTAALICGSVPILMVLGGWLLFGEKKPSHKQFFGLFTGFSGLVVLTVYQGSNGQDSLWGILLVFLASCGWVGGSFYSKWHRGDRRHSLLRTNGIIMTLGALQCFVAAALLGEFNDFRVADITSSSVIALTYLVFMGAVVAYTAYFWLLLNTRTEVAISYEYVNPVIAVFLGWLFLGERVDGVIIAVCVMTVGSVFFIVGNAEKKRS